LGAEKFLDIKCRATGLRPSAVVVVATVKALKHHGKGTLCLDNLMRHVDNITNVYKLPCVVAVNRFSSDTREELDFIAKGCEQAGVKSILSEVWEKGGKGGLELAEEVVRLCELPSELNFAYELDSSIKEKLSALVAKIYRGKNLVLTPVARKQAEHLTSLGFGKLPICVAKTPLSFSDDPRLLGAPDDFDITVRQLRVSAGAGFIVALTGEVMTMPGLPSIPSATNIDIDANGNITGLF
jgi:formate--tetrahydrofolate ligase